MVGGRMIFLLISSWILISPVVVVENLAEKGSMVCFLQSGVDMMF